MIRSVHIENFRSLRDVTLDLEPLTVLVGPNASGKSAVLDALNPAVRWDVTNRWRHETDANISMRFEFADKGFPESRDGWRPYTYQRLQLDIQKLRQPNQLQRALLMVAFLTLQYQGTPVDLVAIEEPERGLHPYLIGELVKLLRDLATGKLGPRPIQFVLATHSAELLEHLRPEEVRFLDRSAADGSVKISRIDTTSADWQQAFREYTESLGSAWLAGGLGGVPGAEAAE